MKIRKSAIHSLRIDPSNADHHIYNNNGTWWVYYTEYPDKLTARRVRRSLETSNVEIARKRRDLTFETLFPSKNRSNLEVHFFPTAHQIEQIEDLALDFVDQPIESLVSKYNTFAKQGLIASTEQWIKLLAIRLALRHQFGDPVIHYEEGKLLLSCLIDVSENRTIIKYHYHTRKQTAPKAAITV